MSIKAPWTFEQVTALNEYQRRGDFHPFTCGNRDDHPMVAGDKGVLIATTRGWICPYCDYTQDWAHEGMLNPPRRTDADAEPTQRAQERGW